MDVTISQQSPVLIKAEVNVAWEDVSPHFKHSLNKLRQNVQVPGFRKGKAPAGMIKKRYRQEITDELARKIVPKNMETWIKEKDIKAVGQPRLHHVGFKENEHFHYGVFIEILPTIELQAWDGIEAERLKVLITDEMVDSALKQRITQATKKGTISDRGIEDGDHVAMSLTVIEDQASETLTDIEDYEIILGGEGAHPQISQLILGLSREEVTSKHFEASEEESHFESWAGKKLTAHMEIKDVFRLDEPALDDAFAQSQDCEDLAALKKKVREALQNQAEEQEKMETQTRVIHKLMEAYDFEVPFSLVEEEAQNQVKHQLAPYIKMMGDSFLDDKLMTNMMASAQPQAAFKIRTDLVLEKIAEAQAFSVSDEELDSELEQYVEAFKAESLEHLKEQYKDRGLLDGINLMIKRRKALEAVVEAAKIEAVDQLSDVASDDDAALAEASTIDDTEENGDAPPTDAES